jgi:putative transposase
VKTTGGTDESGTVYQRADRGHPSGGPKERKADPGTLQRQGYFGSHFYTWRKRFGGMAIEDVQRLRELEKENARLKKLLAERDLELDVVKEALTKNW